ncbi:MAG: phosphatidate cytidylyltransferase [Pirellulaceae bacterium]|nr:MAG: phosphatidate cytidylyltransferase [Pirellulaceae bacterium]
MTIERNVAITLGVLVATLVIGSIVRFVSLRRADPETRHQRMASLRTWWVLVTLTVVSVALGSTAVALMLAIATCLGLRELEALSVERADRWLPRYAVHGLSLLWFGWLSVAAPQQFPGELFYALILLLTAIHVFFGTLSSFTRRVSIHTWGWIVVAGGLGHCVLLTSLPAAENETAGTMGWFLFVLILTEISDISQALVGRQLGRRRLAPILSPKKTWEGFLGGLVATPMVSMLLAPWLTSLASGAPAWAPETNWPTWTGPLLAGVMVTSVGLIGDLNMSAVKRCAGVKDSSQLLPGMGGMLDRVDSLTFTAPAFYAFVHWWCI